MGWKGIGVAIITGIIGNLITPLVVSIVIAVLALFKKVPMYMVITAGLASLASTLVILDHVRDYVLPVTVPPPQHALSSTSQDTPKPPARGIQSESPKRPAELKVYFGTSEAKGATFVVPLKDSFFFLPVVRIQNSGGSDATSVRTRLYLSEPVDTPGFGWQKISGITKGSEFYFGGFGMPPLGAGETWTGPEFSGKLGSAATEIDATVSVFYGAEKPAKAQFKIIIQR